MCVGVGVGAVIIVAATGCCCGCGVVRVSELGLERRQTFDDGQRQKETQRGKSESEKDYQKDRQSAMMRFAILDIHDIQHVLP